MGFERLIVAISLVAGLASILGAGVARACDASDWLVDMRPRVSCIRLEGMEGKDGLVIINECSDAIEITPEGCAEPCSETVRVASNSTEFIPVVLPEDPKDHERRAFDYKLSEQTGTIAYEFELNLCDSEDAGCSAAASGGRSAQGSGWLVCFALIAYLRRVWRLTVRRC